MSVVHLPQSPLSMLKLVPPLSLGREDTIVHCCRPGCRWRAIVRDDIEATVSLEQHYAVHDAERAELARRVDMGGVPA